MDIAKSIGLAVLLVSSWPAAAAASDASARTVRLGSAADVMALAEQALGKGDARAAELAFQAMLDDPRPAVRAEARFRLAKMLAAAGRTSEAAVLLRRVVDEHPAAAPARLELAALLSKMGHQDSALRELRALRTAALPPSIARFVDRWSASLQASKPSGIQVELALAPDSNINRATASDTLGTVFGDFTVDEDSKRKSGFGLAARASAHRRFALGGDFNLIARAVTDMNLYRHKDFNDIAAEISVGPEFKLFGTRFTAEAGFGQRWYGMEPFHNQWRLSASATRPIGTVSQLRLDASYRSTNYKLNDLQDGSGLSAALRFERALSPSTSIAAFVLRDRFKARDDAYSTKSWSAGLTAYRDVGRMTLSLGGEIGRLSADERLILLPEERDDKYSRCTFGAVFRQFTVAGFAPMTRLIVERNKSTVEFYDFKRTRTEIGISRAF